MAIAEDINERIRRINPRALELIRYLTEKVGDLGVPTTEDMTREEKIMSGVAYYMKKGMTVEEAEKAAIKTIETMENIMAEMQMR